MPYGLLDSYRPAIEQAIKMVQSQDSDGGDGVFLFIEPMIYAP